MRCWPRQAFITTMATTSSWAPPAESTSEWQQWASLTQVYFTLHLSHDCSIPDMCHISKHQFNFYLHLHSAAVFPVLLALFFVTNFHLSSVCGGHVVSVFWLIEWMLCTFFLMSGTASNWMSIQSLCSIRWIWKKDCILKPGTILKQRYWYYIGKYISTTFYYNTVILSL